jgi:hypothetical protein
LSNEEATLGESTGFKSYSHDDVVEGLIRDHIRRFDRDQDDVLFHFPVLARRQGIKRFLAHSDFFRQTLDIPGDILEVGVFRGLSLMTWANLLECFLIGDRTKRVWGIDNWSGFSDLHEADGPENVRVGKAVGGFSPRRYKEELEDAIAIFDADRFVPWKDRVKLIEGDASQAIDQLLSERPGLRFSLVHFDVDLYEPTAHVLNAIWERVPKGGILLFDEYGIEDWPGESAAVDEFLEAHPMQRVRTLDWTNTPAGFVVKV